MTAISQLPAEEIHRLMTTPGAMRLEDIPLVHLRATELLKQMAEMEKDAKRYQWIRSNHSPVYIAWYDEEDRPHMANAYLDAAIDAAMQDRS